MAAAPQGALASADGTKMAVLPDGELAALQSLLKQAPSRDAVRQLCRECFSSPATDLGPLAQRACPSFATGPEQAEQLVSALHNLTRHVVYCGLTEAEDILSLFPENFHQNLKNLLTKIILENISAWRNEAEASQISLPRLVDMDWRVDIKTSSDSISGMAVPTCLLQLKIQEDVALCGNSPVVSALTLELSKETLDTMLEGLGRIRDQLSAVANK
ncbi:COMM domain-containing protein 9 isoform X3 [Cuculus canorus]|uniref:COMM domain-containing protein 9 isoform X3 n=1 Tax=Cuculus canorus TaxID=55661 RepID=UPI0023AB0943|nr:COMM domain-containing protein 9 isoform X3 [Cuculus canorus]